MAGALRPRWGQPMTGIVTTIAFFVIAWITWYILSDPRGPVGWFPYPMVMILAVMILVGLWQHMFLGDWPFQKLSPAARGVVMTIVNAALTWFVIEVIFYRVFGMGFNFLSQSNLNALAAAGATALPGCGASLTLEAMQKAHLAQSAIVGFVLIGFYSYPFVTILFAKWPIRPSNLEQPEAGLAEIGWCSLLTLFFYVVLIVPFFGTVWGKMFGSSIGFNTSWWVGLSGGTAHVYWVFGWWEWMIIVLFMTPNVWRMKPWTLIKLPQPWKGLISFCITVVLGYAIGLLCYNIIPLWAPMDEVIHALPGGDKGNPARFLWIHSAEIAGMTLIPFLQWHHYWDDMCPQKDLDSWGGFWFRTVGVLVLAVINYYLFYYVNFGFWGLGNEHMHGDIGHRLVTGESLIWNFWWIIPLLWNEWFFHKWPFYVHDEHH